MSTGTGASDLLHAEDTAIDQIVSGKAPVAARSPLQLFWRRFKKDKVALAAGIFIIVLIFVAIFADQIGRDVFSRTLAGAQVSLKVAFIGTGLSVLFGVTMGMIAGFYRRWVDT